jgi:hypothetical protein
MQHEGEGEGESEGEGEGEGEGGGYEEWGLGLLLSHFIGLLSSRCKG